MVSRLPIPGKYPLKGDGRTWKSYEGGERDTRWIWIVRALANINNTTVNNDPSLPPLALTCFLSSFPSLLLSIIWIKGLVMPIFTIISDSPFYLFFFPTYP